MNTIALTDHAINNSVYVLSNRLLNNISNPNVIQLVNEISKLYISIIRFINYSSFSPNISPKIRSHNVAYSVFPTKDIQCSNLPIAFANGIDFHF